MRIPRLNNIGKLLDSLIINLKAAPLHRNEQYDDSEVRKGASTLQDTAGST